eukprot:1624885-Rhodomonas_salina.2
MGHVDLHVIHGISGILAANTKHLRQAATHPLCDPRYCRSVCYGARSSLCAVRYGPRRYLRAVR